MNQKERDIQRKLRILKHVEEIGSAVKTCRYFSIGRASFYRWKVLYKNDGEAGLVNKKPLPKNPKNRTPSETVEKVLHLRQTYHLEPIRIVWYLARYHDIKISDAGVYRILKRNGVSRLPRGTPIDRQLADEVSKADEAERRALGQTPETKQKTTYAIKRDPVGNSVKKATGHKCQLCEALGQPPHGFKKRNGLPYLEAHHVIPVSELQIGSLAASNIVTLCANHHRQMHYGNVSVEIQDKVFEILIEG